MKVDKHQTVKLVGTIVFDGLAKHTQITQNNKSAQSLQHFKKEVRDKFDFLHSDKYPAIFLQVDAVNFGEPWPVMPKVLIIKSLQNLQHI